MLSKQFHTYVTVTNVNDKKKYNYGQATNQLSIIITTRRQFRRQLSQNKPRLFINSDTVIREGCCSYYGDYSVETHNNTTYNNEKSWENVL